MPFSLSFNPIWSLVDLVGQQLDDTYYLFTIQNETPFALLPIYQDQGGTIPWSDPIQVLANGTLPINMYWDDSLVYRLEVRQGPTQSDPLIYELDNYIPNESGGSATSSSTTPNQITNPQFADVDFIATQGMTVTTSSSAPVEIAPGWFVITTGSGTLTINQLGLIGSDQIGGNPSYAISIQNVGFTSVILQQKFNHNGALWASQFVASSVTAQALLGTTNLSAAITYSGGSGSLTTPIVTLNLNTGWQTATNSVQLDPSTNPNTPSIAYTLYTLNWTGNVTVNLTNIQLVGQDTHNELYPYQQTTNEQQTNGEFWYYNPKLKFKPIKSYLTAWDFPLNPAQNDLGIEGLNPNPSFYTWDQTIVFQSVINRITTSRDDNGSIMFTANGGSVQMAMIQYLKSPIAQKILSNNASVNLLLNSIGANINGTVSLWYTTNANVPNLSLALPTPHGISLVTTLDENGYPTEVVDGWTEWTRAPIGTNKFYATSTMANIGLTGWLSLPWSTVKDINYIAIVVGTIPLADTNAIAFQSVSLVPGDIPTIPAPQTEDEVLRQCQYYFEKSYNTDQAIGGSSIGAGAIQKPQTALINGANVILYPQDFQLSFNTIKINTSPDVTFFSTSGLIDAAQAIVYYDGGQAGFSDQLIDDFWINTSISSKGINYTLKNANALTSGSGSATTFPISGYIVFQYVIDSRLGVVTF